MESHQILVIHISCIHTSPSTLPGAYLSELRNCLLAASLLDCTASHLPAWRVHCEKGGYWLRPLSHPQWQSECRQFTYVVMYQLLIDGTCVFSALGGSGRWFWISASYPRRGSIHRSTHNGVQCFPHHFHEGLHACGRVAGAEIRLWASGGAPPLWWGAGSLQCWRDIPNPSEEGSTSISAVINIRLLKLQEYSGIS